MYAVIVHIKQLQIWERVVFQCRDVIYFAITEVQIFDRATIQCFYYQPEALGVDIIIPTNIEFGEAPRVLQERHHALNAIQPKPIRREIQCRQRPGPLQIFE